VIKTENLQFTKKFILLNVQNILHQSPYLDNKDSV